MDRGLIIKGVARDHMRDVDCEAESQLGLVADQLDPMNVKYSIGITFQIGKGACHVTLKSEETPLTFPPEMLGEVVPEVFQEITKMATKIMNETMEGAFGG